MTTWMEVCSVIMHMHDEETVVIDIAGSCWKDHALYLLEPSISQLGVECRMSIFLLEALLQNGLAAQKACLP